MFKIKCKLKKMETRLREYKELKNILVGFNCYEDGMELQDMRNMLHDLHLEDKDEGTNNLENGVQQATNELFSIPLQLDKASAINNWSPLWTRDETNRLKRKDKSQSKNIAKVVSTSKSPSWQRVDYGCVQNKRYNVNAFQNGRTFNFARKKGSNQAAEQIQGILNTTIRNSPNLVPVNCSPPQFPNIPDTLSKNEKTSNSTLENSTFWSPLWERYDRRLERKHYITDFDLTSFYKKRNFSTLRNGDSGVSVANGHETEKTISSNDTNNANKPSKNSTNNFNLNITTISNGNVNSNLSLNNNNDNDEDVDHSQIFPKSSADLTDYQHNSPDNFSKFNESEQLHDTKTKEHSNHTSRRYYVNDVDRSQTISETSSMPDDQNHTDESFCNSFISDDDVNRLNKISLQNYPPNGNSNHYLSTLYEDDDDSFDDYSMERSYTVTPEYSQHY